MSDIVTTGAPPTCSFLPQQPLHGGVLGAVHFGDRAAGPSLTAPVGASPDAGAGVSLALHTGGASGAEGFTETWAAEGPVTSGTYQGIHYAHDERNLFCAVRVPASPRYAESTERVYEGCLSLVESLGFDSVYRVWHYISDLNGDNADGLEVYRDFCLGRARALERHGRTRSMPAATVIGTHGGGLVLYLLARRGPGAVNLENPGQTPAYEYPARYGPRSPNFARASWLPGTCGSRGHMYVSGTAAILGHATMHQGDVTAQCHLALDNVARVIGPDNATRHGLDHGFALDDLRLAKVYLRAAEDLETVRGVCRQRLSPGTEVRYVVGDVCRADLLVELEAVAW
ncbi:FkbO/Hyg5 family chorismatase [Streptomyces sp. NPDC005438]|uniref:FkbO/Hyg5 family chorismatase n=1 Tax=Streptomyces sp. NPDC005438 TaxID=3156880 RepID=UPI0033BA23D1